MTEYTKERMRLESLQMACRERTGWAETTIFELAESFYNYLVFNNLPQPPVKKDFDDFFKDAGLLKFPYIDKICARMTETNMTVIHASRQLGISSFLAARALWEASENANTTVMFVSSNFTDAKYSLANVASKIGRKFEPQSSKMLFDNGSQIVCRAATLDSFRGLAPDVVIIDLMAYVSHGIADTIIPKLYALKQAGSRLIIASTGKAVYGGSFYRLCKDEDALLLKWQERFDDDWAGKNKALLGSEFANEYECEFTGAPFNLSIEGNVKLNGRLVVNPATSS